MRWDETLTLAFLCLVWALMAVFAWRSGGWWMNGVLRAGIVLA